jgi:structural maintenance of chromosome 1
LENIRTERKTIFSNFLATLIPILKDTYRTLTVLRDGTTGKADIFTEDDLNPFEKAVYFSPTPPTKRFVSDIDQLSGGEKTIASLALQYSLALASKSAFLILDETDAFLDADNVARLKQLIQKSLEGIYSIT